MSLELRPLGGFGVELLGVDLSRPLPDALFREIEAAFYGARLLVVRGQRLDAPAFHGWASRFGRPQPHVIDQFHHPHIPDILRLSNVVTNGVPQGLADAGTYFHTDYSYLAEPARATTLYSLEVPKVGGETLFADQVQAWEDLPEETKARIDGLIVRHHYGNRDDLDESSRTVASVLNASQKAKMDWVRHPLVPRHWYTGRKSLYAVSGSSFGIEGMDEQEARALLDELKAHATQPRYLYRLAYGVGDVVIWDNSALLHAATLTDPKYPRSLWRITVMHR